MGGRRDSYLVRDPCKVSWDQAEGWEGFLEEVAVLGDEELKEEPSGEKAANLSGDWGRWSVLCQHIQGADLGPAHGV